MTHKKLARYSTLNLIVAFIALGIDFYFGGTACLPIAVGALVMSSVYNVGSIILKKMGSPH